MIFFELKYHCQPSVSFCPLLRYRKSRSVVKQFNS